MAGIVYLLQPEIALKTRKFKVGLTTRTAKVKGKNGVMRTEREASYGKNALLLESEEVADCKAVETALINAFNDHFVLCGGKEYFEGEQSEMQTVFRGVVESYRQALAAATAAAEEACWAANKTPNLESAGYLRALGAATPAVDEVSRPAARTNEERLARLLRPKPEIASQWSMVNLGRQEIRNRSLEEEIQHMLGNRNLVAEELQYLQENQTRRRQYAGALMDID